MTSTSTTSKIEARTQLLLSIREDGISSNDWVPSSEEMEALWGCDARELRNTLLFMEEALPGDPTLDAFFNAINTRILDDSLEDRRRDYISTIDNYARNWTYLFGLERTGALMIAVYFDHYRKHRKLLSELRRITLGQGPLSPTRKALEKALDDAE